MRNFTKSCYLFDILWQKNSKLFLQTLTYLIMPMNLKKFIPWLFSSFLICSFLYKEFLKDLHAINQLLCHISMNCIWFWVWELHTYLFIDTYWNVRVVKNWQITHIFVNMLFDSLLLIFDGLPFWTQLWCKT